MSNRIPNQIRPALSGGLDWWRMEWPFSRVRNIFFRGRIFQENPRNSAERATFAKFQAPKFENSEPEKLQFHITPSHSIPPLDSFQIKGHQEFHKRTSAGLAALTILGPLGMSRESRRPGRPATLPVVEFCNNRWEKESIHRPAPVHITFLCRKKWGSQRKDFGGGYGFFLVFIGFFVSTTGLESFSLRPEKFSKRFDFGGGCVRFLLL